MVQRRSKPDFWLGVHATIRPHLVGCGYTRRFGNWKESLRLHLIGLVHLAIRMFETGQGFMTSRLSLIDSYKSTRPDVWGDGTNVSKQERPIQIVIGLSKGSMV